MVIKRDQISSKPTKPRETKKNLVIWHILSDHDEYDYDFLLYVRKNKKNII